MISRHTFSRLSVPQKVLKIADAVRSAEAVLQATGQTDTADIAAYAAWLAAEKHPRLQKALGLIGKYVLDGLPERPVERARAFNFCFHELLALNGAAAPEDPFPLSASVVNFDRDPAGTAVRRGPEAAILDNLRSPYNVGSAFRTGDAFGVGSFALCGITPRPPLPKLERAAMGTAARAEWSYFEHTRDAVAEYRKRGYRIFAVETARPGRNAVLLQDADIPEKSAFIFGNEEFGIAEEELQAADGLLTIPQVGYKNSLNVSCAFAVLFFEIRRRRPAP